jgi:hypothetical protein
MTTMIEPISLRNGAVLLVAFPIFLLAIHTTIAHRLAPRTRREFQCRVGTLDLSTAVAFAGRFFLLSNSFK